mgnify:CR=1 FL=1|tara:strand:- start:1813 stop:2049 length:237 start_codon:yes stop_codon:yes gene_type:complete
MEGKMRKLRVLKLRFRFWVISKLFTDDEKYLMMQSILDRVNNLERIYVNERWANKEEIYADIKDYTVMSYIFSTKDFR